MSMAPIVQEAGRSPAPDAGSIPARRRFFGVRVLLALQLRLGVAMHDWDHGALFVVKADLLCFRLEFQWRNDLSTLTVPHTEKILWRWRSRSS